MASSFQEYRKQIGRILATASLLVACQAYADNRPSVLIILADDLGAIDTNAYGAIDLHTPSLDRLCENGVRLTQFYAAASVCSPSRAGLLTGRYPWTVGVPSNAGVPPPPGLDELGTSGTAVLHDEAITIAELFAAAGYSTGHVGKWHLGHAPGSRPNDQGFSSSFGHLGGCIDSYSHFFYWNGPNRHDLWRDGRRVHHDGEHFLDLMTREIQRVVDDARDAPFFVYWAINAPHYPYQADRKWLEHYADASTPRQQYAAFVSAMDERIGLVLDHLETAGRLQNTIVIFQSDNGHSTEVQALGGGGSAGPYRGASSACSKEASDCPQSFPGLSLSHAVKSVITSCMPATGYQLCVISQASTPLLISSTASAFQRCYATIRR